MVHGGHDWINDHEQNSFVKLRVKKNQEKIWAPFFLASPHPSLVNGSKKSGEGREE